MFGRLAAMALCLAAIAEPAWAQARPPLLPTRNVAIIYTVRGGTAEQPIQKLQATYTAGGDHIRLDFFRFTELKYPFSSDIYDSITDRFEVVEPEQHKYTEQDSPPRPVPGQFLTPDMQFTRQTMVAVAGQPCQNWAITSSDPLANGMVACVTDEGVLLRLTAPDPKDPPLLVATAVRYGPPPDGVFSPPAGFVRMLKGR